MVWCGHRCGTIHGATHVLKSPLLQVTRGSLPHKLHDTSRAQCPRVLTKLWPEPGVPQRIAINSRPNEPRLIAAPMPASTTAPMRKSRMSCRISERLLVVGIVPPPRLRVDVCTAVSQCHHGFGLVPILSRTALRDTLTAFALRHLRLITARYFFRPSSQKHDLIDASYAIRTTCSSLGGPRPGLFQAFWKSSGT